jgi:hypothetical protein
MALAVGAGLLGLAGLGIMGLGLLAPELVHEVQHWFSHAAH